MINMLLAQVPPIPALPSIETPRVEESNALATILAGYGIVFGGFFLLWAVLALVGLIFLIWWVVLLIDLINRDFEQKTTYIVVMIVGLVLGFVWVVDIIYYFAIVKKGIGTKK